MTLTTATTAQEVADGLAEHGWVVVPDVLSPDELSDAHDELYRLLDVTPSGRNAFEGFKTQRVYAALAKTRALDALILHPLALGVADIVVRDYLLSALVAIAVGPGEEAQVVHHDDAVYPLPWPHADVLVSTMWAIDDFTADNGATVMHPGTHRTADRDAAVSVAPVSAEMPAGSVMFYLGTIWHGGGANRTDRPRVGVTIEYLAGWLRQQENHLLAVPQDVTAGLPTRLQELMGYSVYPPFMGYVDGRHPKRVLGQPGA